MNRKDIKIRLQEKITLNDIGCWIWKGGKSKYGYGMSYYLGKVDTAHRIAWKVYVGEIPPGMEVCHNCPGGDNPICCNPKHMFLGTHKQNMNDCKYKTGHQVGSKNHRAILNEDKVLEIRSLRKKGVKIKEICQMFGLKYFTCLDVINRRNWCHL